MTRVASLDLTEEKDAQKLQGWLNQIRYFGTKIHGSAVLVVANEAKN